MMKSSQTNRSNHPASFRDPHGFIFYEQGQLRRQVNKSYQPDFDALIKSGLYEDLVSNEQLVAHPEIKEQPDDKQIYKILAPQPIPFISYPYEWTAEQLLAAAQLTLTIQLKAMERGLSLKDASAYNIQFIGCHPIFIDLLSFEHYQEGRPWVAYRQFCQHFLGPLLLASCQDERLIELSRSYIDGLPIDLTSRLLPKRTYLKLISLLHIHLHAMSQRRYGKKQEPAQLTMKHESLVALIKSLASGLQKNKMTRSKSSDWSLYYGKTNYSNADFQDKIKIVQEMLEDTKPSNVWDFGSNTGIFSLLAAKSGAYTIAMDSDRDSVAAIYHNCPSKLRKEILPLVVDLTNPSPAQGWAHQERQSLMQRGFCQLGLALALIHHLKITYNIPFELSANFFAQTCQYLIIEFVPVTDSNAQTLWQRRQDTFIKYSESSFKQSFLTHFQILKRTPLTNSQRVLYLMKRRKKL